MDEAWLDRLVVATVRRDAEHRLRLEQFLEEPRAAHALAIWLAPGLDAARPDSRAIATRLARDIAALDALIEKQLNAILHQSAFQRLEASWRSLRWLVASVPEGAQVKVRVLTVSWLELARDAERAIEFDQSQLFKKIYSAEFGTPGGEPFGLLIGDYYVSHRPRPDQRVDDVRTLRNIALVSAAAFSPFVIGAHPSLLGLDSFQELELSSDLAGTFRGLEYTTWRAMRSEEDTRFVGLTLPRVLVRKPYAHDPGRRDGFPFAEVCETNEDYLWGNSAFALASVVSRAFARYGWLADIRGTKEDEDGGGLVTGMLQLDHGTDAPGVALRFATEVVITDRRERALEELGLIPLSAIRDEGCAAFYSTVSLHAPPVFASHDATINARMGALLQYVLCVARIAHYIKVIGRDLTGSLVNVSQLERRLSDWLFSITLSSDSASDEMQARCPLRESSVSVREQPGRPGCFTSVFHLRPHFQLDQMSSSMRLVTEIVTER